MKSAEELLFEMRKEHFPSLPNETVVDWEARWWRELCRRTQVDAIETCAERLDRSTGDYPIHPHTWARWIRELKPKEST